MRFFGRRPEQGRKAGQEGSELAQSSYYREESSWSTIQRLETTKASFAVSQCEHREYDSPDHSSEFVTYQNEEFVVNGTGIPDVPFDIGESYAGLLPISSAPNETRELFFWYKHSSIINPWEQD